LRFFLEGAGLVADGERSASGAVPALVEAFIGQLRAVTEEFQGLAGLGQRLPSAAGVVPLPGALSAAQVASITDSIAAQRRSIGALKAQLSSFDEQLAGLEQLLGPLAQWSATWADLEKRLVNLGRDPKGQGHAGGSSPDRSLSGDPAEVRRPPAARGSSAAGAP
jgi:hypothetical protein